MAGKPHILLQKRQDCSGCCACAAVCAHHAIRMEQDGMGFRYPVIDEDACVHCGLCEKVCAFQKVSRKEEPAAEAVRFPDYLPASQSGGVGYALMRTAIGQGRVVYGAAMGEDFVVRHRRVTTMDALEPLRLSKYVQSDMDGIPAQVLQDLKAGRQVLFTGTPCQCAGIGSLCANYRDRLLLVDLICHSAPAPAVWKGFLDWNEAEQGTRLQKVLFRDPSLGWHHARTLLVFETGERSYSDVYYYFFEKCMISRPSCGVCPFANTRRPSDITIGDCWGVEKVLPGFADDNKGCSLVLTSSPQGREFYERIPFEKTSKQIDIELVLQPNLRTPSVPSPFANAFEKGFLRKGFPFVLTHFGRGSLVHRIEPAVKRIKSFMHL